MGLLHTRFAKSSSFSDLFRLKARHDPNVNARMSAQDLSEDGERVSSIHTSVLDKPPCCVSVCPIDRDIVAVGLYNLVESSDAANTAPATAPAPDEPTQPQQQQQQQSQSQTRDGAVLLYRLHSTSLELLARLDLPSGILDLHWLRLHNAASILGAATSTGSIALFRLGLDPSSSSRSNPTFAHTEDLQLAAPDAVVTSFKWATRDYADKRAPALLFTLATGLVARVALPALPAGEPAVQHREDGHRAVDARARRTDMRARVRTLYTHAAEAWIVQTSAAAEGRAPGVWSGGDDMALQWTPCAPNGQPAVPGGKRDFLAWSDARVHANGGVVEVLPLAPSVIAVGSYDDCVRVLREPAPALGRKRLAVLAEANLGGGVWRLIPAGGQLPSFDVGKKARLLACCMYRGAKVLEVERRGEDEWDIRVVARFEEHESMCYGGAFETRDGRDRYLTCSFYDRKLCLWQY